MSKVTLYPPASGLEANGIDPRDEVLEREALQLAAVELAAPHNPSAVHVVADGKNILTLQRTTSSVAEAEMLGAPSEIHFERSAREKQQIINTFITQIRQLRSLTRQLKADSATGDVDTKDTARSYMRALQGAGALIRKLDLENPF